MIRASPTLICATSLFPQDMSLSHQDRNQALINRRAFLGRLGINADRLVCCRQVHSSHIRRVDETDAGRGAVAPEEACADTDALITSTAGLPLAVLTADCFPVFFFDPHTPSAGIAHAGWRGVREGIVEGVVERMHSEFGSRPGKLRVGIGPGIQKCCYEVGNEFEEFFPGKVRQREKRLYLDLAAVITARLHDMGVYPSNISNSGECTCCLEGRYFSFRRQGELAGRMMSVIMLK
mgnify:CR=1 FL=1